MEDLTISMHKIGAMSQKEAIAMRIITVVTLVYLPATFVSVRLQYRSYFWRPLNQLETFFSTDIIKYQNQGDNTNSSFQHPAPTFNGSFSELALLRWLEVTLPLTLLTLGIGWVFFKLADKKRKEAGQLPV